ncbi:hypothetical protein ACODT5_31750 [Streptomyces sp. 5.8]|uniref:hypothetical protein n=1 Tax=Streptomyces sp. 5.8 TaxID=3406571 RepID=UPI003BB74734
MLRMRTSSRRDVGRAAKWSVVALACLLAASGCSAQDAESRPDHLCEIADPSDERDLLRQIVRSDEFDTQISTTTERLVDRLKGDLRTMPSDDETSPWLVCGYVPTQRKDTGRVRLQVRWQPHSHREGTPEGSVPFEANGAVGRANDVGSLLRVRCDMPGDLRSLSDAAVLSVEGSFGISTPRTDMVQADRDRQTTLTYFMARRVTEALGCENKPLEQAPVVKPLPTP